MMGELIYTERRLGKYKNKMTDHIREVYGLDCWLKKGYYISTGKKKYHPLFIEDDVICGLIEIDSSYRILSIYLNDGSRDFNFTQNIIKFI